MNLLKSYFNCEDHKKLLETYKGSGHPKAENVRVNVQYIWNFHQRMKMQFKEKLRIKYVLLTNNNETTKDKSINVINVVEKWEIFRDALQKKARY